MPLVVLLTLFVATPAWAQSTSKLVGCIAIGGTKAVPGATVTASAQGKKVRTVANGAGCYEFDMLPPDIYRITVRGRTINNVTRDRVTVAAGRTERVDFSISGSVVICDCDGPGKTLQQMAERSNAVVYVKISGSEAELAAPQPYFKQTAEVLEILKYHAIDGAPLDAAGKALQDLLKRDPGAGSSRFHMTFLQDQSWGAPEPYEPGEEFVLFLTWWAGERAFMAQTIHTSDRSDRDSVFVVQNGRVTRTPASLTRYLGVPTETLLADLRRVVRRAP